MLLGRFGKDASLDIGDRPESSFTPTSINSAAPTAGLTDALSSAAFFNASWILLMFSLQCADATELNLGSDWVEMCLVR